MLPKICLLLSCLVFSVVAKAEKRALLVGVTSYPQLKDADLVGPKNDTELAYQVLVERGFQKENITLLSESEKASAKPTREQILGELEALVKSAQAGDFYYLHFAGHGSRQPAAATDNTETDGLDEIFLPSDASEWDSYIGAVKNAITDDEIAGYLDRIRDKGTDVWVVFDSCHSGTMTRGGSLQDVRYRQLSPASLGIPESAYGSASGSVVSRGWNDESENETPAFSLMSDLSASDSNNNTRGALIAFSAAQATQTTPEMRLPRQGDERRYHGLFTFTLMNALSQYKGLSYDQLGQYILGQYRMLPWRNSQPLISATDLNATVFGEEPSSIKIWPVSKAGKELVIQAGQMQGFAMGTGVSLYKSVVAGEADLLGTAEVVKASPLSSRAKLLSTTVKKLPRQVFAVITNPVVDFSLSVQAVASKEMTADQLKVLQQVVAEVTKGSPLLRQWQAGDEADLRVSMFENSLWFLHADQSLPCDQQLLNAEELASCSALRSPQRLLNQPVDGVRKAELVDAAGSGLNRIARGENIVRMQQLVSHAGLKGSSKIKVDLSMTRNGRVQAYPTTAIPVFKEGDEVSVTITNISKKSQDISVLYKDSRYGITQYFPEQSGEVNRIEPGKSVTIELELYPEPEGLEDLIILSQPATGLMQDFAFLEQEALGIATRGSALLPTGSSQGLMKALFAAAGGSGETANEAIGKTRGGKRKANVEVGAMEVYRWEVVE
ncbi:caspase family protein [Pontibacterium granulatum]|uniref:caspase family protein n=1 Tax=Pontibacterium granulatum TaxID=2036029 RepID=UPI00249AE223|nr:caspase family protein [Pontibacterium granulatum]MDI3326587.1 caspase family protein [Pontibacterium granulatum]